MSFARPALVSIGVLAAAAGLAAWLLDSGALNISLADLETRYATDDSRFAEVDGVRLHYMDQGAGPAVLLLHASFMNLRTWDDLAGRLSANYRVVRPDFLISGLTGPDPRDEYSMERNQALAIGLMDKLGIDRFAVIGTSSGGIVAFRIAAEHPERVTRLGLVNSAGMPRTARTDPNRRSKTGGIGNWIRARYTSRGTVRDTLDMNFTAPHEPPGWLVDMNYDMWRRDGRREAAAILMRNFRTGDPQATLADVRAPTLVLWGLDNATVMHLEADVFQHWLVNAPTYLKKYPGVGHYLYLEIPGEFGDDIENFLAGRLDAKFVRVTHRSGWASGDAADELCACDGCPDMVPVSRARFTMGFDDGEPQGYEGPPR